MWRKFFCLTVAIFVGLCSLTMAFNYLVDPYNIYQSARTIGFNYFADVAQNHERLFKSIELIRRKPRVLVLGNSKSDFAIEAGLFGADAYNASVRNAQPLELRAFVDAALRTNPDLERIILAVDYEMFAYDRESMPGFDPEQLSADRITVGNFFRTLLTVDAIEDSLHTVEFNRIYRRDFLSYDPDGKFSEPALYELFTFENSFRHNSDEMETWASPEPNISARKFEEFEAIVEHCREREVELTVIILPVARYHFERYPTAEYERWKKKLTSITPVRDFVSIYIDNHTIDNEKIFWDAAHVKARAFEDYICAMFQ